MVSIVIVSHSARLAEGVQELADQMVQGQVPIAIAGGIDDPENPIGTNAMQVLAAIESVYSEDGVLVLMDLGSALLSAEMALEFLAPEQRDRVRLCAAPLVEGAVAAAVQAMVGGSLKQVRNEAQGALKVKAEQLGVALKEETTTSAQLPGAAAAHQLQLTVRNRLGLHARPAARFVQTAARFTAEIQVRKEGKSANAKSINQVATLGVRFGDAITVSAVGPDANDALAAIQLLTDDNFGEREEEMEGRVTAVTLPSTPVAGKDELTGIPASPGIAIGPAFQYRPRLPQVQSRSVADAEAERRRLETAVAIAQDEIATLHANAVRQVGADEAAIFEAHLLFLQDATLLVPVKTAILGQKINAESAWQSAIERTAAAFHALDDPYMRARAADVLDVGQRVLRHLLGVEPPALDMDEPVILLAADLTPSDTARLDPNMVLGLAVEVGGATSHSAILARALGIPAVVGLGPTLANIAAGQTIALDGKNGRLWPQPNADRLAELRAQRDAWLASQETAKVASQQPAITPDGHRIEIGANIGGPHDTTVALEFGAEGVGLFRTEFLFLGRDAAPDEEEQYLAYKQAAEAIGERPLIIRALDVGGDKPVPYLDLGREENPFLGWRGVRFCLDQPHIFKPQLRAILRASVGHNLKLMFPMIGTVGELRRAKAILAECRAELRDEGALFAEKMDVGIMIELPAAAASADKLAVEVDFFSIGTNDLTQYVMAADRGNARVADLADALQPAVLRLIKQTADAAHAAGIWVGMCGELAGNALAAPLLVGLGLDELSMNAPAIPEVKTAVRRYTLAKAQEIAQTALALDSATAVHAYLQQMIGSSEFRGADAVKRDA